MSIARRPEFLARSLAERAKQYTPPPPRDPDPTAGWSYTRLKQEYQQAKESSEHRRALIEALNPLRAAFANAEARIEGLERAVNRERLRADMAEAKLKSLGIDP